MRDGPAQRAPDEPFGGGARGVAAEDGAVDAAQVAALGCGVQGTQARSRELVHAQHMHHRDDRAGAAIGQPAVGQHERRVVELVLHEHVEAPAVQAPGERSGRVVGQMAGIVAPRQRDDLDVVAVRGQVLHQLAVVQVAAGQRVEAAVDDEADPHQPS